MLESSILTRQSEFENKGGSYDTCSRLKPWRALWARSDSLSPFRPVCSLMIHELDAVTTEVCEGKERRPRFAWKSGARVAVKLLTCARHVLGTNEVRESWDASGMRRLSSCGHMRRLR